MLFRSYDAVNWLSGVSKNGAVIRNVTGEVWEIKPIAPKYYISGPIQLEKYVQHIPGAKKGESLGNETFYYLSQGILSMAPSVYKVTYRSGNDGMIYYEEVPIVDPDEIVVAIALMAMAIYSGQSNGFTVPQCG